MSKIQLVWVKRTVVVATSNDFVDSNTHERMMLGGRPVVQVVRPFSRCAGQQQKADNTSKLHLDIACP